MTQKLYEELQEFLKKDCICRVLANESPDGYEIRLVLGDDPKTMEYFLIPLKGEK